MKSLFSGVTKLTAASILVISLVACGGAEERKVKYLEKGKAYLTEKNYDKAKIEFKNVMQIDPKFAEAYFYMGQLDEQNKELGKALGNYNKAIELDPKYTLAKVKLAKIYIIAGTDDYIGKAKKMLAEVDLEQPDNIDAALLKATIEYKTGSKSKAVTAIKSVILKDPTQVDAIALLSVIYIADGKEKEATKLLSKAVLDNGENISLRISLAKLLAKNDENKKAEKLLKEAIALEPESFSLMSTLASFYVSINELTKAEAILKDAIKKDEEDVRRYTVLIGVIARTSVKSAEEFLQESIKSHPDLYGLKFVQVGFYERTSDTKRAKAILKEIISDKSYEVEGVEARNKLALLLLQEGDYQGAKKYSDEVLVEYPSNNDALFVSGKLALINLDAITAINALRTIIKNDPKNAEASLLLAQAHELNKETSLAENELKKAIEANPISSQVHVNYARYLGSKGRIDEAVSVVDKALAYFKDSYNLMEVKLKIVASQGKESEVLSLLSMMEQADPTKADVNISKGQYYLSKRDVASAVEQFEKAYNKSKNKYKSLQLIVKTYVVSKQPEKALERLQKRLDINADDAMANLLMGQVFMSQKKEAEARAKFKKSIKSASEWFLPYASLASTYSEDSDEALAIYKDAAVKLKNKVPAQMQIAAIHEKKKDYARAIETYKQILEENAGNKLAANNYASLLLDFGSDSDAPKALELAKGFERMQQPALQDTLAWAYAKTGDSAKAVKMLKPVVDKAPKIAIFRYHLGYALNEMGDKAAAKSHLEIAVESEQNFPGKDNAKALLKTL